MLYPGEINAPPETSWRRALAAFAPEAPHAKPKGDSLSWNHGFIPGSHSAG